MYDDLISVHVKHVETFRANLRSLLSNSNPTGETRNSWNSLRTVLTDTVIPLLGAAVQLATRSMMALSETSLKAVEGSQSPAAITQAVASAIQASGQPAHYQSAFNILVSFAHEQRNGWINLADAQLEEIEKLLRNPPEIAAVQYRDSPSTTPKTSPADIERVLKAGLDAERKREGSLRCGAWVALGAAVCLAVAASVVPWVWHFDAAHKGDAWPIALAWSTRVVAMAALVFASHRFISAFVDLMRRAAAASREAAAMQALASVAYFGDGKAPEAMVEVLKVFVTPEALAKDSQDLHVPGGVLRELPTLIKLFKPEK